MSWQDHIPHRGAWCCSGRMVAIQLEGRQFKPLLDDKMLTSNCLWESLWENHPTNLISMQWKAIWNPLGQRTLSLSLSCMWKCTSVSVGIFVLTIYYYDIMLHLNGLCYIFFCHLKKQARKKDGVSVDTVSYRTVDCFDHLTTSPFPDCKSVDDLFNLAVRLYGPTDCLGSRELISEEDEVQPNGKLFSKVLSPIYTCPLVIGMVWVHCNRCHE